jgi:carbon monoxide dehydrogenase subunit G
MPAAALRVLALSALLAIEPARAADVAVHALRHDGALYVDASAEVDADLLQTWRVLTDYDHLAEFIPGMHVSRVLAREGDQIIVEQKGEARLLFLAFPIEVKLAVVEFPHKRIVARAVAGNLREMAGTYLVGTNGNRVTLRYHGRMVPDFRVPPLIGTLVLRHTVEVQFGALVDEIARRQARAERSEPR